MRPPSGDAVEKAFKRAAPQLDKLADKVADKQTLSAFCDIIRLTRSHRFIEVEQLSALDKSVIHLLGKTLTKKLIHSNAYRILANWHFIHEGMQIPEWEGEPIDCACTFLGLEKKRLQINNKLYLQVRMKLRSGLAAGIIHGVAFTPRQVAFFLKRISGTNSFNCAIEEISGMRAQVTIEADGDDIRVVNWKCNQSDVSYNRQLAEARRNPRKCSNPIPCNTCKNTVSDCKLAIWLADKKDNK